MGEGHRSRSRRPTAEELALWRAAMRDTKPFAGRLPPAEEPAPSPPTGEAPPDAAPPAPKVLRPPRSDSRHPAGLDRRSWQRLRRGRLPIEGRLDLHGMTQEEAWRALLAFIDRMQAKGARCVLVITGRGIRTGGILRRATPRWLESPPLRERVLGFATARIEHGGEGALYVLLRRGR